MPIPWIGVVVTTKEKKNANPVIRCGCWGTNDCCEGVVVTNMESETWLEWFVVSLTEPGANKKKRIAFLLLVWSCGIFGTIDLLC